MTVYAAGKKAWSICDRCGLRLKYTEVVTEAETGFRVHQACCDEPYVLKKRPPEGIALRHPRPDTNLAETWPGFERDAEIYGEGPTQITDASDIASGMVPNPPPPTVED
jgi:hypothetical protein